ncbi:MAG: hypothetical protein K0R25_1130 [Rickettsiaceae bacterium]|jgi:hypothetical protein|nr:hypothetical protein [Rickettsiaceae bacterium]
MSLIDIAKSRKEERNLEFIKLIFIKNKLQIGIYIMID